MKRDKLLNIVRFARTFIARSLPFIVIALITGVMVIMYVRKNPNVLGIATMQPSQAPVTELEGLLTELAHFMVLPSDEQPALATVSDVEKVRTQSFFKAAKNGDKVLLYGKSKKAILYRPSERKVIEVGYLAASGSATTKDITASESATPGN